uniref:Putative conserved plasma membrane protein n=1 Tax=Panstrongylus megistus TaxID=65343 RepID=A0A069DXF8_9HEMI
MSVFVQKGKPPEGSVRLTEEEAANLQWKLIYNWKPTSDVWPFRYGMASLAVGATLSAILIVGHFRRKLKLRNIGYFAMYMPNVVMPTLALPLLHQKLVTEPILLQTECPVCIQLRSIVLQNGLGLIYPLILSPTCGFLLATSQATIRLPILSLGNLGSLFSIYRGILQPFTNRLLGLSLFHTVLAVSVTEAEARSFFKLQRTLLQQQNFIESEPQESTN